MIPQVSPNYLKIKVFRYFLEFGSFVSIDIAYRLLIVVVVVVIVNCCCCCGHFVVIVVCYCHGYCYYCCFVVIIVIVIVIIVVIIITISSPGSLTVVLFCRWSLQISQKQSNLAQFKGFWLFSSVLSIYICLFADPHRCSLVNCCRCCCYC